MKIGELIRGDKMKKWAIISIIGILIVGAGVGWYFMNDMSESAGVIDNPTNEELEKAKEAIEESFSSENPNEEIITGSATDGNIQSVLHKMSHQKVRADQKWGKLEITKERLEYLSVMIEENKDDLEYYETYRDILDRWIASDFSRAHIDHNKIWQLQNGTIGEATGLLNEAEEAFYIEENFR